MHFIKVFTLLSLLCLSSCLNSDDEPISTQEQFSNELKAIDDALAKQNITPLIDVTDIRFVIEELGKGLPPTQTSRVRVNYVGKFLDGTVFEENTYDETFENTIYGWRIAMSLMPEGTKATFYLPSAYCYGTNGAGEIPGNTPLVFTLDLEKVYVTEKELNQLKADTLIIDEYITTNEIDNIVTDTTGLRYALEEPGNGAQPTLFDKVKFRYSGSILSNGNLTSFTDGAIETTGDTRVINFINGLNIGLQKMREGGKATFYIPSGLAYGDTAQNNIPSNAILVFDVDLLEVTE